MGPHRREFTDSIKSNKILIERAVKFNIVPLTDQPEFRLAVAVLNDFYQFFLAVTVVFRRSKGVFLWWILREYPTHIIPKHLAVIVDVLG